MTLPAQFAGVAPAAAPALYRASLAHACAHRAFGGPRFPLGTLKPLQVALVTLVEDARVEALAMRRFPGLRRLWRPYHQAAAGGVPTAEGLLAQLARGLFDPDVARRGRPGDAWPGACSPPPTATTRRPAGASAARSATRSASSGSASTRAATRWSRPTATTAGACGWPTRPIRRTRRSRR